MLYKNGQISVKRHDYYRSVEIYTNLPPKTEECIQKGQISVKRHTIAQ